MTMNDPTTHLDRGIGLPTSLRCTVAARPAVLQSLHDAGDTALNDLLVMLPLAPGDHLPGDILVGSRCIFLEVDPDIPASIARLERLRRDRPDLIVVAIVDQPSIQLVRSLMRSGVRDVIGTPLRHNEVASILFDLAAALQSEREKLAPVVALASPTGGAGATTVITHLATALMRNQPGKTCCVVDLDLQYGDVANYLGLSPKSSIMDLLEAGERLDNVMVSEAANPSGRGPVILAVPNEINPLETVGLDGLQRFLRLCRAEYDIVLLDLPSGWTNWVLATIIDSDVVLMLTEPSLHSIRRTRRCLNLLDEVGLSHERLGLIVNNVERKLLRQVDVSDVEDTLRRPIMGALPSEGDTMAKAQDQGLLLEEVARKTHFVAAIDELAANLRDKLAELSQ
jgi:pilus assembly protein CpaE